MPVNLTEHGGSADAEPSRQGVVSWSRSAFTFPVVLAAALVLLVVVRGHSAIADADIWWHLRNAKMLLETHHFVRFDTYSFTASGHAWTNTEWLSEIPYYLAWHWGGLLGIELLTLALFALLICGVLYLSYRESGNLKASFVASCVALLLASVSFAPRTILFGYICMLILLVLLHNFRRDGRVPLWIVPILFCVWANLHGSWLLGLIIYAIVVASGMVEGSWGAVEARRWSPSDFRKLIFAGVASVAAVFVNPYGARLVVYPLDLAFRQKLNVTQIAEWVSVDFHDTRGRLVLALLVALLLGALFRTARWTLTEVALLVFGLYCGLTYVRFHVLLGILAAPVLAKMMSFLTPHNPRTEKAWLNALLIFSMLGGVWFYRPTSGELDRVISRENPAGALPFLAAHPLDGPLLNYFAWGGYLGWKNDQLKVFIDSRVDIFEYSGAFQDYLDLQGSQYPQQILDKYKIRYVLFPPKTALIQILKHDPQWQVMYQDEVSVFLRRANPLSETGIAGLHESR